MSGAKEEEDLFRSFSKLSIWICCGLVIDHIMPTSSRVYIKAGGGYFYFLLTSSFNNTSRSIEIHQGGHKFKLSLRMHFKRAYRIEEGDTESGAISRPLV